jgi:hypothetical protein
LTINHVQAANAGSYRATVRNAHGSATTSKASLTVAPTSNLPDFEWVRHAGTATRLNSSGQSLAVDDAGNVYAVVSGGLLTSIENRVISRFGEDRQFTAKYDRQGNLLWVKPLELDPNPFMVQDALNIVADKNGNVIISGTLTGFSYFPYQKGFTAKYDTNGNLQWTLDEAAIGMAVDGAGNVYLTTADHIAKYDTGGNLVWTEATTGIFYFAGQNISVDAQGNIYLVGASGGEATVGLDTIPDGGLFLAKYDANFNLQWRKMGDAELKGICVGTDASGNVFLNASAGGGFIFDNSLVTSHFGSWLCLLKYDGAGQLLWTRQSSGGDYSSLTGFAVDAGGNAYSTGAFYDTMNFDGKNLVNPPVGQFIYTSYYIVKYGPDGALAGARQISTESSATSSSIAVNRFGEIYFATETGSLGTLSFGKNSLFPYTLYDWVLTKLGPGLVQ